VPALFAGRGDGVVAALQRSGVSKLGEFVADSRLVYPAFGGEPLLTLGTGERDVDHERLWTRHMQGLLPKGERATGGWRLAGCTCGRGWQRQAC
jgi:hypothetical protein